MKLAKKLKLLSERKLHWTKNLSCFDCYNIRQSPLWFKSSTSHCLKKRDNAEKQKFSLNTWQLCQRASVKAYSTTLKQRRTHRQSSHHVLATLLEPFIYLFTLSKLISTSFTSWHDLFWRLNFKNRSDLIKSPEIFIIFPNLPPDIVATLCSPRFSRVNLWKKYSLSRKFSN